MSAKWSDIGVVIALVTSLGTGAWTAASLSATVSFQGNLIMRLEKRDEQFSLELTQREEKFKQEMAAQARSSEEFRRDVVRELAAINANQRAMNSALGIQNMPGGGR